MRLKNDNRGVVALLTVIIVSAAVLVMAYSASVLGLGELDMGYTSQRSSENMSLADACLEEALQRLRINSSIYIGGSLSLGNGSCIISVSGTGGRRTVVVSSTINTDTGTYNKKIQAEVNLNGNIITLDDWQEKSD